MSIIKKLLMGMGILCLFQSTCFAETSNTAMTELSFTIPSFVSIVPETSPVLVANITDDTGNLYAPLSTRFRVFTNDGQAKTLYLSAKINTQGGMEQAMFEQGGRVYIAFGNLKNVPTSSSLSNCKHGGMPQDSPGIVAYPVTSIQGAEKIKFVPSREKYEVDVKAGLSRVTVNVGSTVLRTSFASNDPKGYYQAVLALTEADI